MRRAATAVHQRARLIALHWFMPARIEVSDATLAMADEVTRTNAATSLVAAAEQVLSSHPEYVRLEAISVAIIHPGVARATGSGRHIEDDVGFRQGPNQRLSLRTT